MNAPLTLPVEQFTQDSVPVPVLPPQLGEPDRYLVTEHADGMLVLTPAVIIAAAELAALERPDDA